MKINYDADEKGAGFIKKKLAAAALENSCDAVLFVNGKKYEIDTARIFQGKDIYDAKLTADDGTEIRAQLEKKTAGDRTKVVIRLKV